MTGSLSDPIASFEEYRAAGGTRGLDRALQMTPEAVIDEVEARGLRGHGGAGFPWARSGDRSNAPAPPARARGPDGRTGLRRAHVR